MKTSEYAATIAVRLAADNSYGYSNDWPNNRFGVDPTPKDGDCGAFCSYVYSLAGVIPMGEYYEPTGDVTPWNEQMLLKYFNKYDYDTTRNATGDILTSTGHTVMITGLDPDEITHAANDYDGRPGDSSGREIRTEKLYSNSWNWIYRLKPEYDKEIPMSRIFKDVDESTPGYEHIKACKEAGLIVGYDDGTFHPDQPVTRTEIAVIMDRIMKLLK